MKAVEGERLSLSGVQRSDMGGFLCIASNGIPPSVSRRYDVQVNCKYRENQFKSLFKDSKQLVNLFMLKK